MRGNLALTLGGTSNQERIKSSVKFKIAPQQSILKHSVLEAFVIVIIIVVVEYLFRHYVLYWYPQIGALRVNDMLSLSIGYVLLVGTFGFISDTDWRKESVGLRQEIRKLLTSWEYLGWVAAMYSIVLVLPILDQLLWGDITLPFFTSPYRNPLVLLKGLSQPLIFISLLLVNGLFIPFAEEFLWRGLVQPRLATVVKLPIAIGVTAVLFSLKHVIVDGGMGRFLMVIGFGAILGLLAQRKTWRSAAAIHMFVNSLSTITLFVVGQV